MTRTQIILVVLILLILSRPGVASSLDSRLQLTQHGHRTWRVQDGSLPGEPAALAQTPDGYLWIATSNGLARFDGVSFKNWHELTGKDWNLASLLSLGVSRDGTLWVGCACGLYVVSPDGLTLTKKLGGRINDIVKDARGDLWAVRSRLTYSDDNGPLCKLTPRLQCFSRKDGVAYDYGTALSVTPSGVPWMGSSLGLSVGLGADAKSYPLQELKQRKGLSGVSAVIARSRDEAWVGLEQAGAGLLHFANGHWTPTVFGGGEKSEIEINTLYQTSDNEMLVGTFGQGLYRISTTGIEHYDHGSGLSGDTVQKIFEDSQNDLWVVTQDGLDEFYLPRVVRLTRANGIAHGTATTVNERANGEVWIGDHDRFDVVAPNASYATRWIKLAGQVTAAYVDHLDRLWAGVGHDLVVFNGDSPRTVKRDVGVIQDMGEDGSGRFWIKVAPPTGQILRVDSNQNVSSVALQSGDSQFFVSGTGVWFVSPRTSKLLGENLKPEELSPDATERLKHYFSAFSEGPAGTWLATRSGIGLFRNGNVQFLTRENGLACDNAYAVDEDAHHDLWVLGSCGIQRIDGHSLDRWLIAPQSNVNVDLLGARDGSSPAPSPFDRNTWVTKDGRVWFANESIVQVVDPKLLDVAVAAAPLLVERVAADHQAIEAGDVVRVPVKTHDLQIDYTSLDLREADRVVFRYRLVPYDKDWVDAGSRRTAYYTGVPPGRYTFEVLARPPHGSWSSTAATLRLEVLPAFYQTLWFRCLVAFVALAATVAVFCFRIRYATIEMQRRLDTQMTERVRIARELHDTILQGFYGLLMRVQSATNRLPCHDAARLAIEKSLDEAETTLREGRETIRELRGEASSEEDLLSSLQVMAAGMVLEGTNEVSYRVTGDKKRLHPVVRTEMLRVGREALWNALAHASATRIEVVVAFDGKGIALSVSDDGVGMEAELISRGSKNGHWGLRGMRERSETIGGSFQIASTANIGTRVTIRVPAAIAFVESFTATSYVVRS